ncbi:DMT family transporter [Ottowia sp. VDI28]|uniref:DMT family transporter n=1 Tax=Ottowia sp. VDI28 TaxID=3133968 RepID=UPI003C2C7C3A
MTTPARPSTPGWSHARAVWAMVAVTLMWSVAGVVTRQLTETRGFEITFWRSFFTVLALLVIMPLWQGIGWFRAVHWTNKALLLSGVCWSLMFTAFMVALTLTSVGNVLVTMAVGPLFTALVARIAIGHRMPARTWAAIAVAGAGIAYMFMRQFDTQGSLMGMAVALGVPIGGAINWTVVQRSQAHGERVDLVPAVLVGAVISTLAMLPFALPPAATKTDLAWLAMLGSVQLAIPCVLSVLSARVLKAPEVSLLALLEVIFGILWAWWGAGEAPGQEVLIGGFLVIGALLFNELLGWRSRQAAPRIQTLDAES